MSTLQTTAPAVPTKRLVPMAPAELTLKSHWGKELSFRYEGRLINDGVFICMEDDGVSMRLMFAGSTFGRFDINKTADLAVIVEDQPQG